MQRLSQSDGRVNQGHPGEDAEEVGPSPRGRQLDGEGPRSEQDREPGGDHPPDQDPNLSADCAPDRGVNGISPNSPDQAHVQEVRPDGGQTTIAEEQTLNDQDRRDDHRPGPGTKHDRRQDSPQQVSRDRQRSHREVHHLGGEDEGRHRSHQHCGALAKLTPQQTHAESEPGRGHTPQYRRHLRIEYRVRDMHRSIPTSLRAVCLYIPHDLNPMKPAPTAIVSSVCRFVKNFIP